VPTIDDRRDDVLLRAECLRLLATVRIGRLCFTRAAMPAIQPVSFSVRGEHVLIPALAGTALVDAVRDSVVAFEADEYDVAALTGWAVTVVGHARVLAGRGAAPLTTGSCLIAVGIGVLQGWRTTLPM
jgi:nitroimidazol reductase NimA-like FMN-containing flavoprotein (pyridoxamine 5'-phosphate oxidase superfamily)